MSRTRLLHIQHCVVGANLEVHGRFDIDNREQVDPQLETEALHRAVKTAMLQLDRFIIFAQFVFKNRSRF